MKTIDKWGSDLNVSEQNWKQKTIPARQRYCTRTDIFSNYCTLAVLIKDSVLQITKQYSTVLNTGIYIQYVQSLYTRTKLRLTVVCKILLQATVLYFMFYSYSSTVYTVHMLINCRYWAGDT